MSNIFIALIVAVLSFQFFTISFRLNGINRTLLYTPRSLFEISIPLVQNNDYFIPYFDKELLEYNLTSYYDNEMKKYSSNYSISFYYFNKDDHTYCIDDSCDAVEVKIEAYIILNYQYKRLMDFYIRSNVLWN